MGGGRPHLRPAPEESFGPVVFPKKSARLPPPHGEGAGGFEGPSSGRREPQARARYRASPPGLKHARHTRRSRAQQSCRRPARSRAVGNSAPRGCLWAIKKARSGNPAPPGARGRWPGPQVGATPSPWCVRGWNGSCAVRPRTRRARLSAAACEARPPCPYSRKRAVPAPRARVPAPPASFPPGRKARR